MAKKAFFVFGIILCLSVVSVAVFSYVTSPHAKETLKTPIFVETFPNAAIENLWISYRDKIQKDGRTIDRSRNFLTTSEGQSYSLLRSVWMGDKDTFDRVLNWTNHNLRVRKEDKLFAWKWGQNSKGSWTVLADEGGYNTASDADQDIALALIFAHKKWGDERYINQAKEILNEIWRQEVVIIKGKPYMTAGNWAVSEKTPTLNPSYFSFFAYPIFAEVDTTHNWNLLKETSYDVLNQSTAENLDVNTSAMLPPDWVGLDRTTGKVVLPMHNDKVTDFSDDAFRVLFRVALDWEWNQDPRAKSYLEKLTFLNNEWRTKKLISRTYKHDGQVKHPEESDSFYGAYIVSLKVTDPKLAEEVFIKKIAILYNPDTEEFKEDIGYYAQNWVWFGMAAYKDKLPNLYKEIK